MNIKKVSHSKKALTRCAPGAAAEEPVNVNIILLLHKAQICELMFCLTSLNNPILQRCNQKKAT